MRNHLITLLVVVIAGVLCATIASAVPVEFAVTGSYGYYDSGAVDLMWGWQSGSAEFAGRIYYDLDMTDPDGPTLNFVSSALTITSGYYHESIYMYVYDPETDTWSVESYVGDWNLKGASVLFSAQPITWGGGWSVYDSTFDLKCPVLGGCPAFRYCAYVEFTTPISWSLSPLEDFFVPAATLSVAWDDGVGASASLTGSQVPEPGTLALIAPALLAFAGIAFRRHLAHASKIIALAAAFALLAASAAAYADDFPKLEWVRSSSTLIPWDHTPFKLNAGQSVAFDNGGNIYVTGYYDHGSFDDVEAAMWLNKYDASGNSLWSYNSPWSDYASRAYDVATDAAGDAYVVGSIYLYPESGEEGPNISVQKFGPSGNIVWTRTYNGEESGWDEARGVAVDSTGNVYIAGYQNGTALDEPGQTWLRKYDSNGNWLNAFDPEPADGAAYDIAVDPSGNVLVTGVFGGGNTIAKYDPLGNVLWTHADGGLGVAVDAAGNVYATGAAYASKYDADGNLLWTQPLILDSHFVDPSGIAVDADGYVYVVGTFVRYYEYYGNPGCDSDIWLQMYNANGIPIGDAFYGSHNVPFQLNEGYGVAVDPNAKYCCVTGYIDPYDWGIYGTDMVVLKYNVAPEPGTLALIAPALLGFAGIAFRKMRKG